MAIDSSKLGRGVAAAFMAFGLVLTAPAQAAATISQAWVATWDLPGPFDAPHLIGQASGGSGNSTTITANVPKGSLSGKIDTTFDAAQGRLRSGSTVDAQLDCCTGPDDYGWGKFNVLVYSSLDISDQLTVDHDGYGFMKIMIRTTGNMVQNGQIQAPPYGYSDVKMTNKVRINASVAGGEAESFEEELKNDFVGIFDDTFQVNETQSIYNFMELIVLWSDDEPVDFTFHYSDFMQYAVDGVDAEGVTLHGENNFGHTMELFANVYDDQGQLLQGVQVGSSSGIGYLNLDLDPGPNGSVPEPSSLALAAFGALAWVARRRRPV